MKLIGLSLYQRLLARAVEKARGSYRPTLQPELESGSRAPSRPTMSPSRWCG